MSTNTITVSIDAEIQKQAEVILSDTGLSLAGLFNACLKLVVRENAVPTALFGVDNVVDLDSESKRHIREMLEESLAEAADPNTNWLTHEEIFGSLREKIGHDVQG